MKIRDGLVSNSSSSSFIISKNKLTDLQIYQIKNYQNIAYELGGYDKIEDGNINGYKCGKFGYIDDRWNITETLLNIKGDTIIDNFDFCTFLPAIGVKSEDVIWGD